MAKGKHFHKDTTKMNIPLRVAAVLLCLASFSAYFVTGLFARYTASTQTDETARVAKFSIEGGGTFWQSIAAGVAPGETQTETLIVENNSEVAVEYTITVKKMTSNLPLSLRLEKVGSSPEVSATGTTYTVKQLPGSHTDEYRLTIEWPVAEDKALDLEKVGMVDHITVAVTAVQID